MMKFKDHLAHRFNKEERFTSRDRRPPWKPQGVEWGNPSAECLLGVPLTPEMRVVERLHHARRESLENIPGVLAYWALKDGMEKHKPPKNKIFLRKWKRRRK